MQSSMTATMERVQPYETPRASSDPAPNNQTAAASWPAMPDATIKSLSNKPSPSQVICRRDSSPAQHLQAPCRHLQSCISNPCNCHI